MAAGQKNPFAGMLHRLTLSGWQRSKARPHEENGRTNETRHLQRPTRSGRKNGREPKIFAAVWRRPENLSLLRGRYGCRSTLRVPVSEGMTCLELRRNRGDGRPGWIRFRRWIPVGILSGMLRSLHLKREGAEKDDEPAYSISSESCVIYRHAGIMHAHPIAASRLWRSSSVIWMYTRCNLWPQTGHVGALVML